MYGKRGQLGNTPQFTASRNMRILMARLSRPAYSTAGTAWTPARKWIWGQRLRAYSGSYLINPWPLSTALLRSRAIFGAEQTLGRGRKENKYLLLQRQVPGVPLFPNSFPEGDVIPDFTDSQQINYLLGYG